MNRLSQSLYAMATVLLLGCDVSAAEPPMSPAAQEPTLSKEQREQMAAAHERMAQCLRSDRSFADCHKEMRAACKQMGPQGCPAMNGMHDRMMRPAPQPPGHR